MRAIASNNLPELEDSVATQQTLCCRLSALSEQVGTALRHPPTDHRSVDPELMRQVAEAANELKTLNLRYSLLLKHSSRSVGLMAALFNSYRGQIQEASGARPKVQTWSCRM
jgi:hypothetical protein